mgnify:CR=1 FL=1
MFTTRTFGADQLLSLQPCLSQSESAWSVDTLREALNKPHYFLRTVHLQGIESEIPVGFLLGTIVVDECSLLYVEVIKEQRNKGCGQTLITDLISLAKNKCCHTIHLEVRQSNLAAIALHLAFGFVISTTRKAYYPALPDSLNQNREDALLMNLNIA